MLVGKSSISQNGPSFKAKVFFSQKAYNELPFKEMLSQGKYVGPPWHITDSKIVDEGFSDCASVCTMGFIKPKDAEEGFLFHCIPIDNPFDMVREKFLEVIDSFKKYKKPLEGFLVGADCNVANSMKQAQNFMNFFDDQKIDYSAALGQKYLPNSFGKLVNPGVDMYASSKGKYIIGAEKKLAQFLDFSYLDKRFEIVKKSPNDEFIFE